MQHFYEFQVVVVHALFTYTHRQMDFLNERTLLENIESHYKYNRQEIRLRVQLVSVSTRLMIVRAVVR